MTRSDSLDDVSSQASFDSDEDFRLAQQEWEESLHQLQQLVSIVLLPFFGKWLAYYRYLRLGLGKSFLWG
ncbi:hypothetical protein FB451DRAFT_1389081 [Mycena latifolia]|nr:hypothetical protein FB451DRAFT_1389081 [Mycena latifolia]